MKHIIAYLGIIGILAGFSACTKTDSPAAVDQTQTSTAKSSSSVAATQAKSSATTQTQATAKSSESKKEESTSRSSSSKAKKDTVVVTEQVTIDTGATTFDDPYFSSGIFCWTDGCEAWASSASGPDVPEDEEINVGGDVPVQPDLDAAPVVEGLKMTDMRDSQVYVLKQVGGKIWTAQNMNIALSGSNCYGGDAANCTKYGRLYNFSAAESVCPSGWKLPSRADFEAAKDDATFWNYGGRGKNGTDEFMGDMGFFWLDASETLGSEDKDNCNGAGNCGMIFVIDAPEYGEGESKFQSDSHTKAFSVRCVLQ